ncbi:MAG TPA: hypothetical protein VN541_08010 [Tepidisphaeraceae bacterium]|nr:hypothetical protein [Tepidisphaeraceae bacterium]
MKEFTQSMILGIVIFPAIACGAVLAGINPPSLFGNAGTPPTTNPAEVKQPADPWLLDEVDVPAGQTVADFLKQIQHKAPVFQYVAEPGPWKDAKLPAVTLRSVSVDQIPLLLTNLDPTISFRSIKSPYGGINTIYVFGNSASPFTPTPVPAALSAFGLADPVERIGLRNAYDDAAKQKSSPTPEQIAEGRKKALQEVLSLLEAAASQADPNFQASLKLHTETAVLLVRGTAPQLKAISEAINALQSNEEMNRYRTNYLNLSGRYESAQSRISDMTSELAELRRVRNALQDTISKLRKENASLTDQIHATGKSTAEEKR